VEVYCIDKHQQLLKEWPIHANAFLAMKRQCADFFLCCGILKIIARTTNAFKISQIKMALADYSVAGTPCS